MMPIDAVFSDYVANDCSVPSSWCKRREVDVKTISSQTQVIDRLNRNSQSYDTSAHSTQTCQTDWLSEQYKYVPDDIVVSFLSRVVPLVEDALLHPICMNAFEEYEAQSHDDIGCGSAQRIGNVKRNNDNQCVNVSAITWNSNAHVVAVAYGRSDHSNWCRHIASICTWNLVKRSYDEGKPDLILEAESCVSSVSFHPTEPAVIAAGLFAGQLCVWDLAANQDDGADNLIAKSHVDDVMHREPIVDVQWVEDIRVRTGQKWCTLASIGGDGRVLVWTLDNHLQHPLWGARLVPTQRYHGHGHTMNKNVVLGGTSLSFSPFVNGLYVVGTEGGGVLRCSRRVSTTTQRSDVRDGKLMWTSEANDIIEQAAPDARFDVKRHVEKYALLQGLKRVTLADIFGSTPPPNKLYPRASDFAFKPHIGAVRSVEFSPFHRHLLLSCGTDSSVRVYHIHRIEPLLTLEPSSLHGVLDAKWSRVRPLVLACGDAAGALHVYDLEQSMKVPVLTISTNDENHAIVSLAFTRSDSKMLAVACCDGNVGVWKLSERLSTFQASEQSQLNAMCEQY